MDSELFKGRAAFYEFFTAAFHTSVDVGLFNLTANFAPHLAAMAEEVDTPVVLAAAEGLQQVVSPGVSEDLLIALSRSFVTLFRGDETKAISQLESAYRGQAALDEVKAMYAQTDFAIPANISQDHMSAELLFMYYLSKQCADLIFRGDEAEVPKLIQLQKDFLNQHIMWWIPQVCDMVNRSPHDYILLYRELAHLLKAFLRIDKELLDEM